MTLRDLALRFRAILSPRRVEQELDDELAFHLEKETEKLVAQGMGPNDARARARAHFGSVALAADQVRDQRGIGLIDSLRQDLRYAFTTFRRAPLSALTVVATVALGLSLVAAVFSTYSAFYLRLDAVRNPEQLFEVRRSIRPGETGAWIALTRADFDALRTDTHVFTDVAARVPAVATRLAGDQVSGTLVSTNFFDVLGARAAVGRALTSTDETHSAIVLSYRCWTRRFASNPSVAGTVVMLGGQPYEIVGVMPKGFAGGEAFSPDFWAPLARLKQVRPAAGRDEAAQVDVIGRLPTNVSPNVATAALSAWADANPAMKAQGPFPKAVWLSPLLGLPSMWRGLLNFLPIFAAFGLILLVACANVANLLLARGVARQREIGIRLSLGASRRRIIRQLLTESFVLALAAAAVAYGLSGWIVQIAAYAASAVAPPSVAEGFGTAALGSDWHVVLFLIAGAVLATTIFGLMPALHGTRIELIRVMRGEVSRDARPGRARQVLIALQVTASALLVIGAGVFLRSMFDAANARLPVRTTDVLLVKSVSEPARPSVLQAVRESPIVARVATSRPEAMAFGDWADAAFFAPGSTTPMRLPVYYKFISPAYFSVLDVPIVKGRSFTGDEQDEFAGVAIVTESTARRLWHAADPIGQTLHLEAERAVLGSNTFRVVGVVRDTTVNRGMSFADDGGLYLPARFDKPGMSLVMRVNGDVEVARRQLVEQLLKVDPAIGAVTTMDSKLSVVVFLLRLVSGVTIFLATVALVLTLSGLFGVLSFLVARRSTEIGVRMALGATPSSIAWLMLSQSAWPVGGGLCGGAALAAIVGGVLTYVGVLAPNGSIIRAFDPMAFSLSLVVTILACAAAAAIPALRARRVDPVVALRQD